MIHLNSILNLLPCYVLVFSIEVLPKTILIISGWLKQTCFTILVAAFLEDHPRYVNCLLWLQRELGFSEDEI
ncbi:hypothetical protein NIES4071_86630 [Calothrix sp. NIES-4071]|nr:hypothetical protein NIES4071_86630 [Calothrix sp. NIES-4071]BAZ62930.1 hypothetical protein NIES4105_86560 [Calothrix sp. NIES-4105]